MTLHHSDQLPGQRITREKLMAFFLCRYLAKRKMTKVSLARHCFMSDELMNSLLAGSMPSELIEDDLIVDISETLDVPPNVFRIILGHELGPNTADGDPLTQFYIEATPTQIDESSSDLIEAIQRFLKADYKERHIDPHSLDWE